MNGSGGAAGGGARRWRARVCLLAVLALPPGLACGRSAPGADSAPAIGVATPATTTAPPRLVADSSLDRPAPLGASISAMGYRITVSEVVGPDDADATLDAAATAEVSLTNAGTESLDPASDLSFAVIAPDGGASRHYDCDQGLGPEALLDGRRLFPGGSASGLVCFELDGRSVEGFTVMVTGAEQPLAPESTAFWGA